MSSKPGRQCAVTIDAATLDRARGQVLRAVSKDPKRPQLQRVRVEIHQAGLRLVATDAARLVLCDIDGAVEGEPPSDILATADGLEQLPLSGEQGNVRIEITTDRLAVTIAGGDYTVATTDEVFPNYAPYLADRPEAHELVVDRSALLSAIEDQPDDEPLRLCFRHTRLECGDVAPIAVPAEYAGEVVRVLADPVLLHDAVDSATGTKVAVDVETPVNPIRIRSTDDDTYLAIIMPMRSGTASRPPR